MIFSLEGKRIWVAGHAGMVGSAIVRRLAREKCDILTVDRDDLDLIDQRATDAWITENKPDAVFLAAAKVGGISANERFPADFIYQNLAISTNVIAAAHRAGVGKMLVMGSSCIYPRLCSQPIAEESLLTGPLEPTNQWYAVAKIAGIKMSQAYRRQYGCDFISVQPTNLYGPGDNFHPQNSHVPAGLLHRFHEAKLRGDSAVDVWGTGRPRREFLCVDDLADACVFLMKNYSDELPINVGTGEDITISEFSHMLADVVGFGGEIRFDSTRPDGAPRKLLDTSRLQALGWRHRTALSDGLAESYAWYLRNGAMRDVG
jgi:GDP-L-fucose synthase